MLSVEKVAVGYQDSRVLYNMSLQVEKGRLVGILGRNGVGKTTLLKAIVGLLKVQEGSIMINDDEITAKEPEKRVKKGIGYIPQGREIFPTLTVEENLLLGLEARKSKTKTVPAEVLELFPVLPDMLHRKGGDLSGGQQQQLAFARALVGEPSILLLDEPTEGIQPSIVSRIQEVILTLARENNIGIMMVDHNIDFLLDNADYIYVIDRGTVMLEGKPQALDKYLLQGYLTV
ncbi:urea ABC transporter ATP-binding subunit UrtE [Bacillus sp. CECT 9360]|uniref:urea ABC transporter ATP-binding subunit UrtE n=1 Tax=Bacillus sp. CECT 9360 TaxID=2845821 RepID=UPI001E304AC7|nr:urea ABC transporter ATP-binding subunit UrtE [Bacillus sp. CECT 9360]CAH0346530.1 High-affinity branched-chain amino acid transport ATP-binding protein LivF [Bacillus sp. CECT 9360]